MRYLRHEGALPRLRIALVDTAAHGTALAVGGRAAAVIGTGLRCSYPAQNARLQQEIAERGMLISQFWPDAAPSKVSFRA